MSGGAENKPKLRFKDDQGNHFPDWEEKKLRQLAARVTKKNTSVAVTDVLTNSAVQGIISQGDYFDHDVANAENLDRYTVVELGDFVYNPRISVSAPVGPIKRNNLRRGVMSPLYDVFRFQVENTDYWEHFFASASWYRYMKQVANYGARHDRMAIATQDFLDMPLPFPHPDEQRKVAGFLGAVDAKIGQLTRKKALLEDYKKGCMQQLFTQKIRFKDDHGNDFPDWEEKKLERLLFEPKERNRALEFSKDDVLSVSGEFGCVNQIEFMGRSYAGVSVRDYHVVRTGDVVYTKSPLKNNPYGIIKANKGADGIVSTLYAVYRPTDEAHANYIDYYFQLDDNLNRYLRPIVRKGAKNDMKVNNTDVLGDPIEVPHPDEQRKIADFLSAIDAKISLVADELSAAQDFKKGLLQQMFV